MNESIINQIRQMVLQLTDNFEEKRMFGCWAFMVEDKFCMGVRKDSLMLRLSPEDYPLALEKDGCTAMMHRGEQMGTYISVSFDVMPSAADVRQWAKLALDYNPLAPLSKAKQKAKNKSKQRSSED